VGVYRIQKSANALPEFLRKGVHWVPSRSDIIFNANEALRPASFIRPFSADLSGRLCPVIACNELMSAQFAIQLFETPMKYRSLLLAATSEVRGSLSSPKQFWMDKLNPVLGAFCTPSPDVARAAFPFLPPITRHCWNQSSTLL
jgi:hypothetical protein